MTVQVFGAGCPSCNETADAIRTVADEMGVVVTIKKVQDVRDIVCCGILSTPGVVIDGTVVHAGGRPRKDEIARWLAARR